MPVSKPLMSAARLSRLGFSIHLDPDGLMTVTPADQLTPELTTTIRFWRNDLAAELLMHDPQPIPWNEQVGEALIRRTAESFARLSWTEGIIPWAQTQAPEWWQRYVETESRIDTAFSARDMQALAYACRDWWNALRQLVTQHAQAQVTGPVARKEKELSHV